MLKRQQGKENIAYFENPHLCSKFSQTNFNKLIITTCSLRLKKGESIVRNLLDNIQNNEWEKALKKCK